MRPSVNRLQYSFMSAAVAISVTAFAAMADDSASVTSTINQFHEALRRGDGAAAMKLLAPDAVILESGFAETRAEYEAHHLQEDILFARTVRSTRSDVRVQVDGNIAWLTSRSSAEGSFEGKAVKSSGVELAVLTKTAEGWRIRAIHWSSRKMPKSG